MEKDDCKPGPGILAFRCLQGPNCFFSVSLIERGLGYHDDVQLFLWSLQVTKDREDKVVVVQRSLYTESTGLQSDVEPPTDLSVQFL
jgi:hypothetical protein